MKRTGRKRCSLVLVLACIIGVLSNAAPMQVYAVSDPDTCQNGGDHEWGDWMTAYGSLPATCTEGTTQIRACNNCSATETRSVPALGHDYQTTVTKEATCTEEGVKTMKCTRCGDTKTETIAATGHSWDNGTVTKQPTCTEDGVRTIKCTRCGETHTEVIPKTGHTIVTTPGKAATCTEQGLSEGKSCSVCGEVLQEQGTIPALGHDWDNGKEKTPATNADGQSELPGEREIVYTCRRDASHTRTETVSVSAISLMSSFRNRPLETEKIERGNELPLTITEQPVGGTLAWDASGVSPESYTMRVKVTGGVKPYTYEWRVKEQVPENMPLRNLDRLFSTLSGKAGTFAKKFRGETTFKGGRNFDRIFALSDGPSCTTNIADREYYCVIRDAAYNEVISDTVAVKWKLHIIKQPADANLISNLNQRGKSSVTLSVAAAGGTPLASGTYAYAWYAESPSERTGDVELDLSKAGVENENGVITGEVIEVSEAGNYYCVVSDAEGERARSDTATVHNVMALYARPVTEDTELRIGADTDALTIRFGYGGGVAPYTVEWIEQDTEGGFAGIRSEKLISYPAEGVTETSFSDFKGKSGWRFQIRVTDATGSVAESKAVTITYRQLKIAKQPQGGKLPQGGGEHTLFIEMEEGTAPFTFHLFRNAQKDVYQEKKESEPSASFTVTEADNYYIRVTDADGQWVISDTAEVQDYDFRIVSYTPEQEYAFYGGKYAGEYSKMDALHVVVEGGEAPYRFSWKKVYDFSGERPWYGTYYGWHTGQTIVQEDATCYFAPYKSGKGYDYGLYACTVTDANGATVTAEEMEYKYRGDAPYIIVQPRVEYQIQWPSLPFHLYDKELLSCYAILQNPENYESAFQWQKKNYLYDLWEDSDSTGNLLDPYVTGQSGERRPWGKPYRCVVTDPVTGESTVSDIDGYMLIIECTQAERPGVLPLFGFRFRGGFPPYSVDVKRYYTTRSGKDSVITDTGDKPWIWLEDESDYGYGCSFQLIVPEYKILEDGEKCPYTYLISVTDSMGNTGTKRITHEWSSRW